MSKAKFAFGAAMLGGIILVSSPRGAQAQTQSVPSKINFQGRLNNAAGVPINAAESILFTIWNAPTGGAALWSETQNPVIVSTGIYNVALGAVNPLPPMIFLTTGTYLGVTVGGDPEMAPRIVFQTTPYAFTASSVLSALPLADLFSITPVNLSVSLGGYTVPGGKNLVIVSIDYTNAKCGSNGKCNLGVSGTQNGTNISGGLVPPGEVLASTSAAITFGVRGALIPASVPVVIQDLNGTGGTYTTPGGAQSLYFGTNSTNSGGPCTGSFTINGFATSQNAGGILPPGTSVVNNVGAGCTYTLDGYLK